MIWRKLRGRAAEPRRGEAWQTDIHEGEPWPEFPEPPEWAPELNGDALAKVVESLPPETPKAIEIEARRQLWRSLNDPCRIEPPFDDAPSSAHQGPPLVAHNLRRLLNLLPQLTEDDQFEAGEILRELGQFEQARGLFDQIAGERAGDARFLSAAAAQHDARVKLLPPDENLPWAIFQ